ncbi:MAG: AAA family ATPase [Succinivibrio sp.]|nr:AAA family ATPase [Succinivibrio sp.]
MTAHSTALPEDFAALREAGLPYVDKTACLKEIIEKHGSEPGQGFGTCAVMLIPRPHGFGKTLTLSMMEHFYALNYENPQDKSRAQRIFAGLAITEDKEYCAQNLGEYPVISLSLKSVVQKDYVSAMAQLSFLVSELYKKFSWLLDSSALSEIDRIYIQRIISLSELLPRWPEHFGDNPAGIETMVEGSLKQLSRCLENSIGRKVLVMVDDYDVPIQYSKLYGYDREMNITVGGMFGDVFKTNNSLLLGILAGTLHINPVHINDTFNNYCVFSMFDWESRSLMGFTETEVHGLLEEQGLLSCEQEVRDWYGGYHIAGKNMLCPRSVLKFCLSAKDTAPDAIPKAQNFRADSPDNELIEICLRRRDILDSQSLQNLLDGGTEQIHLPEGKPFASLSEQNVLVHMLAVMLHTGYVTAVEEDRENYCLKIKIPNLEILDCFRLQAQRLFSKHNTRWQDGAQSFKESILAGNAECVQSIAGDLFLNYACVRDADEPLCRRFMLDVLTAVTEAGQLSITAPDSSEYTELIIKQGSTAAVLLIKQAESDATPRRKANLLEEILRQLGKHPSVPTLLDAGFTTVWRYALVFANKSCCVRMLSPD